MMTALVMLACMVGFLFALSALLTRWSCDHHAPGGHHLFALIEIPAGVYSAEVQYVCQCARCGVAIRYTLAELGWDSPVPNGEEEWQ